MNIGRNVVTVAALAGLAMGLAASGCKSKQRVAEEPTLSRNERIAALQTRTAEVSGPIARPGARSETQPARLIARQRLEAPAAGPDNADMQVFDAAPGDVQHVKYSARDATPEEVVRVLVGEFLDRPFVLDAALRGAVTLDVDAEMTTSEIESLMGVVASMYGWTVEVQEGVTTVRAADSVGRLTTAPILRGQGAGATHEAGVRIFKLSNIAATQAAEALKEFTSAQARIAVVGRMLVCADRMGHLNRLGALITALDAPAFDGAEMWTYQLSTQQPGPVVQALESIATASNLRSANDARVSFVALPGTRRVMVISRDASVQPMVQRWIEQIDQPRDETKRQRYFYKIQHFDSTELVRVVKEFLGPEMEEDPKNPNDLGVRITSAAEEDLLLIYATPADYLDLLALLQRIDAPRQQVFLQSVIAEVNLSDSLAYGVEYFLQISTGEGDIEFVGEALQNIMATGSAFFVGSDGFALIEALDRKTDVRLLSAPSLFVEDKAEASIQVGGETPILTSATTAGSQTGGDTDVFNDIEYRPTGVTLTVQPRISETGSVQLTIRQEISDAIENSSSAIDSPEFTTRVVETKVSVPDGQTLVLGGIISNDRRKSVEKIPLLGDAPLVGPLFRGVDKSNDRVELMLAITPTIVSNLNDVPIVTSRFLEAVSTVREALEEIDMSLSTDVGEEIENAIELDGAVKKDTAPNKRENRDSPADGFAALAEAVSERDPAMGEFLLALANHARSDQP